MAEILVAERGDPVEEFCFVLRLLGVPRPIREHRFHPGRKFRFDLAWPEAKVYVEVEGGVFVGGRHTRGPGYRRDCEKYNLAALMGWVGLRFTTDMLRQDPVTCGKQVAELLTMRGLELGEPGADFPDDLPRVGRDETKADKTRQGN